MTTLVQILFHLFLTIQGKRMHIRKLTLAGILSLTTTLLHAAGLTSIEVPADTAGPALKVFVWTPCATPPIATNLGPFVMPASRGCPVAGKSLPLIIISHGRGGSSLGHHDTAEALADAGFIVAAPNHPGDNFSDMSRSGDISAMIERPTDIKRLVDFMLGTFTDAAKIDPARIGFFGFSRGGYTGLVLAGGKPDFRDPNIPCPDPAPICGQLRRNEIPTQPLTQDPRVKAFVLADPLSFFSKRGSLKDIKSPIQLWGSQYGGDGVLPQSVVSLAHNLPGKPEFHLVTDAGHFAFLAPCPTDLAQSEPAICADAPAFNRATFHQSFNAQVLQFFQAQLLGK